jgi:ribosome-binding protein aMBF1 (putative translation factor)
VNPDHLWLGTRLEHIRDTARKKQYSRGAEHWMRARREQVPVGSATSNAKLNEEQVASIRRLYEGGGWQQKQLAAEFGVSEMTIHYIVHRRTWKHVA